MVREINSHSEGSDNGLFLSAQCRLLQMAKPEQ